MNFDFGLGMSDEDRLRKHLNDAISDEEIAGPSYEEFVMLARQLGYNEIADAFESAAKDEKRHRRMFKKVRRKL